MLASGTNSRMEGTRLSVRLPSRIVPIWVSEPMGLAIFFFTASTPAMNVVLTAPSPGINTPSFPVAGAIWTLSWANWGLLPGISRGRARRLRYGIYVILTFHAESRDCAGGLRRDFGDIGGRRE